MKTQKIVNLLNGSDNDNAKFATKKWYIIDSESNGNYSQNDEIKFLTRSIESSLCDYSDAYILVTGNITATPNNAATQVVFKNCAPSEKCRTEINETFADETDFINITLFFVSIILLLQEVYGTLEEMIIMLLHLNTKQALLVILKQMEQKME